MKITKWEDSTLTMAGVRMSMTATGVPGTEAGLWGVRLVATVDEDYYRTGHFHWSVLECHPQCDPTVVALGEGLIPDVETAKAEAERALWKRIAESLEEAVAHIREEVLA